MAAKTARPRAVVPSNERVPHEVRSAVDALGLVDYAWGRAIYTDQEVQWAVKRDMAESEKNAALAGGDTKKVGNLFF